MSTLKRALPMAFTGIGAIAPTTLTANLVLLPPSKVDYSSTLDIDLSLRPEPTNEKVLVPSAYSFDGKENLSSVEEHGLERSSFQVGKHPETSYSSGRLIESESSSGNKSSAIVEKSRSKPEEIQQESFSAVSVSKEPDLLKSEVSDTETFQKERKTKRVFNPSIEKLLGYVSGIRLGIFGAFEETQKLFSEN